MTIRVINFSDDIESSLVPADIPTSGQHIIEDKDGTDFTSRTNLQFNDGFTVTDDMTNNRTIVNVNSNILRVGRLEVTVVNNSGADLAQYSAYSLEDNAYDLPTNTVTLTSTRTGIPTQGQTALFFCQEAIADGTTGIGVIKGLVTTTVLQSVDKERDLKVLPSGSLSDIVLAGEYVIATVTRSPLLDTPLEIAFDGLSNYKFVTTVITEFENNGTRVGDNTTNKLNFANNITAVIDAADPTTININSESVGTEYIFEDEGIALANQALIDKINFRGTGVSIALDGNDTSTLNINIGEGGTTGTAYTLEDEGITLLAQGNVNKLNFVGSGVEAVIDPNDDTVLDINIAGGNTILGRTTEFVVSPSTDITTPRQTPGASISRTTLFDTNGTGGNLEYTGLGGYARAVSAFDITQRDSTTIYYLNSGSIRTYDLTTNNTEVFELPQAGFVPNTTNQNITYGDNHSLQNITFIGNKLFIGYSNTDTPETSDNTITILTETDIDETTPVQHQIANNSVVDDKPSDGWPHGSFGSFGWGSKITSQTTDGTDLYYATGQPIDYRRGYSRLYKYELATQSTTEIDIDFTGITPGTSTPKTRAAINSIDFFDGLLYVAGSFVSFTSGGIDGVVLGNAFVMTYNQSTDTWVDITPSIPETSSGIADKDYRVYAIDVRSTSDIFVSTDNKATDALGNPTLTFRSGVFSYSTASLSTVVKQNIICRSVDSDNNDTIIAFNALGSSFFNVAPAQYQSGDPRDLAVRLSTDSSYENIIVFDTEDTNTIPATYSYNDSTGLLTMNTARTVFIQLSLTTQYTNINNFDGDNYRLGLQINGSFVDPSKMILQTIEDNDVLSYIFTASPGDTFRIAEFIPTSTQFVNIATRIDTLSSLTFQTSTLIDVPTGHIIQNNTGTELPEQAGLQFSGILNAVDDAANNRTVVSTTAQNNTYSDLGTASDGVTIRGTKTGSDLPFKRLKAGTGITLNEETNDVEIIVDTSTIPINLSNGFAFVDAGQLPAQDITPETIPLSYDGGIL